MPGAPAFLSDRQTTSATACGHIQDYRPLKDPGSFWIPNPQLVAWVWALSPTPALHQVFLWPFRPSMLPLGWDRMVLSVGNVCWFFFPLRFVHSIFCLNFSSLRGGLRSLPVVAAWDLFTPDWLTAPRLSKIFLWCKHHAYV